VDRRSGKTPARTEEVIEQDAICRTASGARLNQVRQRMIAARMTVAA
jgi:hypothetical protein